VEGDDVGGLGVQPGHAAFGGGGTVSDKGEKVVADAFGELGEGVAQALVTGVAAGP
jgi:hypothetical protein